MKLELAMIKSYFDIPDVKIKGPLLFNLTLNYARLKYQKPLPHEIDKPARQPWNRITSGLYLGKIPEKSHKLKSIDQATDINEFIEQHDPKRPLGLVITVLDYFEMASIGLVDTRAVQPKEWKNRAIHHHHLMMSDFGGNAPKELILLTLFKIHEIISAGESSVYLHCKAGVGRSALVTLAYLAIFGAPQELKPNSGIDAALAFLKTKRAVRMNPKQIEKAKEVFDLYQQLNAKPVAASNVTRAISMVAINQYLADIETKNAIRHLVSFKELAIYAAAHLKFKRTCKRSEHIREVFNSIYSANDATWYAEMMSSKGPLHKLVHANPLKNSADDANLRLNLVNAFKEEVTSYIARAFQLKEEALVNFVVMSASKKLSTPNPENHPSLLNNG